MPIKELRGVFPNSTGSRLDLTSEEDINYNCASWALEENHRWWEPYGLILPAPSPPYHWPPELPQDNKAATYVRLFEMNGYELAADESLEQGYKKVALYIRDVNFQHAARQLSTTKWTSKIGKHEDIRHELRALERDGPYGYGTASIFMRKPK